MRRHDGSRPVKSRRHRTTRSKARIAPSRKTSAANWQEQLDRRTRERDEALERETATSEVLRLISKSPGDLESVFRSILENATRICEAKFGILFRVSDGVVHAVAALGLPPAANHVLRGTGAGAATQVS